MIGSVVVSDGRVVDYFGDAVGLVKPGSETHCPQSRKRGRARQFRRS